MDEPRTPPTPPAVWPHLERRDVWLLALLGVLTLGLRTFQLATTEVTARDSISYIHIAWQLGHGDWLKVIPAAPQHPGYPVAILAASVPARLLVPNDLPYAMQLAAQLVSAAASVLLVAPLYWLGRELFSRRVGFGAVLLFQCLPCSGRITADGLSEGVFLLFAVSALALAVYSLRSGSVVGFAFCGLAGGLAYLTRPEGLLIPAAAGLTLVAMQMFPRWRRPWRRLLACGAALAVAVLLVGGPFMVLIHGITNKNAGKAVLHDVQASRERERPEEGAAIADGPPFAVWWQGATGTESARYVWGLQTLATVLCKAFFFVFWAPALVGVLCLHRRWRAEPGAWMILIVCAGLACLLFRVAVRMGYLSDRHTILILTCGLIWAAAALDCLGRGAAALLARAMPTAACRWWTGGGFFASALLVAAAAAPLIQTLEPLHGDRVGFRAAGRWLAKHAKPDAKVFDPFGWAAYYGGRFFRDDAPTNLDDGDYRNTVWDYLVLEKSAGAHSHLVMFSTAQELAASTRAHEVARFPAARPHEQAWIVVYAIDGP